MAEDLRSLLRSLSTGTPSAVPSYTAAAPANPLVLFEQWLRSAIDAGCVAPHAATLSTVGAQARTLIVKDVTESGIWFASRTDGPKIAQVVSDPHASLTFFWREQLRQVRVYGTVSFGSREESIADFQARPPHSRATAMLGTQSAPLPPDIHYPEAFTTALARAEADPGAGSDVWTVCVLNPTRVEFWASTPHEGQIRIAYQRAQDAAWTHTRLWP